MGSVGCLCALDLLARVVHSVAGELITFAAAIVINTKTITTGIAMC